jgi:hypothetical protein
VDETVALYWQAIDRAGKYLLEIVMDDESPFPLAMFSSDTLSTLDEDLPPDAVFTYQLAAVVGSARGESRVASVRTLPLTAESLTATLEFDQTQPLMDFSTIDPENYDPAASADLFSSMGVGGDDQGFDVAIFVPTLVSSTAVIGPDGGEVSVTGSTGLVYT